MSQGTAPLMVGKLPVSSATEAESSNAAPRQRLPPAGIRSGMTMTTDAARDHPQYREHSRRSDRRGEFEELLASHTGLPIPGNLVMHPNLWRPDVGSQLREGGLRTT
jgi:hypothetical protein